MGKMLEKWVFRLPCEAGLGDCTAEARSTQWRLRSRWFKPFQTFKPFKSIPDIINVLNDWNMLNEWNPRNAAICVSVVNTSSQ